MTDGIYCWPEGLAHYVRHHQVRLPEEFVRQVEASAGVTEDLPTPTFDELGMRDRDWPGEECADLLWKPASLDHGHAYVEVDADWWLHQNGLRDPAVALSVPGPIDSVELLDATWQDGPEWGDDPWIARAALGDGPSVYFRSWRSLADATNGWEFNQAFYARA